MAHGNPEKCSVLIDDSEDNDPSHTVSSGLFRRRKQIDISPGHYTRIEQVLDILNNEFGKAKMPATFIYHEEREKVSLYYKPGLHQCAYSVDLSAPLAEKLGWPRERATLSGIGSDIIEAPGVIKLDTIDLIFVHCDLASDSHVVGDVKNCLLRVVPVWGKHGSTSSYEPMQLDWLPVRWHEFRTLRVLITDSFGEKIPFERGVCTAKLLVRRLSPFGL